MGRQPLRQSCVSECESCRQEVCRNTDDSLELINACGHVSEGVLKVVKNLVHYIASHSVISLFIVPLQHVCRYGTSIIPHHIVLLFICSVKTLCVVNHYLSLCDTCVHMRKPTHGEQRDFVTDEMQQGSSSVMLQRLLRACCFFHLLKGKGRLAKKENPRHFNLGFSVQAYNIY